MKQRTALGGTAALAIFAAGPALAEVTAMQVWEKWRSQAEATGQTITAETEVQGDTLRLTDFRTEMTLPEGTAIGTIEFLEFRERPDGTVAITMAPRYTFELDMTADGERAEAVLAIEHTGLSMIASGDTDAITYDFLASSMTAALEEFRVEGEPQDFTAQFGMGDMDGSYTVTAADTPEVDAEITAGSASMIVGGTNPEDGTQVDMAVEYSDLTVTMDGVLAMIGSDNTAEMLREGFAFASDITHGPATYRFAAVEEAEAVNVDAAVDSGSMGTSLDASGMAYDVAATGMTMTMTGSDIPFPELTLSMEETGLGFVMPVQASKKPEDFGMNLTLAGLTVSDMLWSMLDPAGALPRDPATLILAVSGRGNWTVDIMDPAVAESMEGGTPGELHALTLDEMRLSLAGAELTGGGAFTFDNSDLETFEGIPRPAGALDLQLVGGQALLDTLVEMGLLPEEQAMNARMMLGLFARPGDGEDTLVSTIEITEDGGIVANGQQLQ